MLFQVCLFVVIVQSVLAQDVLTTGVDSYGGRTPVSLSVKDGYALVVFGYPQNAPTLLTPSVNMYDFEQHLEARKVEQEGVCYIKPCTATLEQAKQRLNIIHWLRGDVAVNEEWNVPGEEIQMETSEEVVGSRIAEFCSQYKMVWIYRQTRREGTHLTRRKRAIPDLDFELPPEVSVGPVFDPRTGNIGAGMTYNGQDRRGTGTIGTVEGLVSPSGDLIGRATVRHNFGNGNSVHGGASISRYNGMGVNAGFRRQVNRNFGFGGSGSYNSRRGFGFGLSFDWVI